MKKLLLILSFLFVLPMVIPMVKGFQLGLDCPVEVAVAEEARCDLTLIKDAGEEVVAFEFRVDATLDGAAMSTSVSDARAEESSPASILRPLASDPLTTYLVAGTSPAWIIPDGLFGRVSFTPPATGAMTLSVAAVRPTGDEKDRDAADAIDYAYTGGLLTSAVSVETGFVDSDGDGVDDRIEPSACIGVGSVGAVYLSGSFAGCWYGDVTDVTSAGESDGCVTGEDVAIILDSISVNYVDECIDPNPALTAGGVDITGVSESTSDGCVTGEDVAIILDSISNHYVDECMR